MGLDNGLVAWTQSTDAPGTGHSRHGSNGRLQCSVAGLPCIEFHTTVYNFMDIGLAIVHLDGAPGGPTGVVAVIPAARRTHLRTDFAFEFVTFLSFLGGLTKAGSEPTIHDYIDNVLRTEASCTQIFAVETAHVSPDISIVLSSYFEHLPLAMVDWLGIKDFEQDAVEVEDAAVYATV